MGLSVHAVVGMPDLDGLLGWNFEVQGGSFCYRMEAEEASSCGQSLGAPEVLHLVLPPLHGISLALHHLTQHSSCS